MSSWNILFLLLFWIAAVNAQTPDVSRNSFDVIQVFCAKDYAGKRLTPAGRKELSASTLKTEADWEEPTELLIISDYSQRPLIAHKRDASFLVTYHVIGRIDGSLGFVRLQTPYTNQPVTQSEDFSLVWTDTHFELDAKGNLRSVEGTPEWRIKTAPVAPHVGLAAAIQYVRMASNRTKDPIVKAEAQKTLADLEVLSQFQFVSAQAAGSFQQGPEEILSQFAQMQMDGAGLPPGESSQLGIFLVHPAQWRQDKIAVARGFGVRRTAFSLNKAGAYIQYESLGEINLQLRFTSSGASGNAVRQNYTLLFDNDYSSVAGTGNDPYANIGPSRWRIEQAPDEQWVSVATAIKYVTQMRDSTRDPSIKANADKTLAILAQYR